MPAQENVAAAIARNLKELRHGWGWSFDTLAERSGVSRGMLVRIEKGTVNPSIGTLVRLADAMGTNVARLIDLGDQARIRVSGPREQAVLWRGKRGSTGTLLGGSDRVEHLEAWAWNMGPGDGYTSAAHPVGTEEFLFVTEGTLTLQVGHEERVVEEGSAVVFDGDHAHGYANHHRSARLRFVMFVATPGRSATPVAPAVARKPSRAR